MVIRFLPGAMRRARQGDLKAFAACLESRGGEILRRP
jgi:hypothetical protein